MTSIPDPLPARAGRTTGRRAAGPVALLLLALLTQGAIAQGATPSLFQAPPQNVLTLEAQASTEVPQDLLTIVLVATREGGDAAQVQSQLRQTLEAALAEARRQARPGELEVRTGGFSLYPRTNPKPGGQAITGWIGRAELVLEGRSTGAVSALAGRLAGMTVQQVMFSLSREARDQAEAEVSAKAIERFRSRAERHAKAFGFASYSLREVTVSGSDSAPGPVPMVRMATRAMASPMADEGQPVEAGKTTVTVTVSGSVQLSPR